jgi:hypothetical protein
MSFGIFDAHVGKEVAVVKRTRYGGFSIAEFGVVTKINGHGHIFVTCGPKEYRFNKSGDSYKNEWGPSIGNADKLREELARDNDRKARAKIAKEIEGTMKSGWSYSGDWIATKDRIEELKGMISKLETIMA